MFKTRSAFVTSAAFAILLTGCNLLSQAQPTQVTLFLPPPTLDPTVLATTSATETTATPMVLNVIDIVNQTQVEICAIYAAGFSAAPVPTDNLLTTGLLVPGASSRIALPDGDYELTAHDCNERIVSTTDANFTVSTFWPIVEVSETPIYVTLTFVNHTDQIICRIMAGKPNTDGSGDILNDFYTGMGGAADDPTPIPVITIPPGGSVNVTTAAGERLTFEAFGCDGGSEIDSLLDVEITGDLTWEIGE